ncbi:MAG: tetratricopeptide repeat protein [Thermoanaerobaculia bacterium]|nr:tetratricopeptide repeat protein [Thermoanaerobaculia bacterium]
MLVPLAALLVYWNSLSGGFVWDDRFLIVDNPRVQSFARFAELVTHDYVFVAETDLSYGYFRPLASLSLATDYALWGSEPFGYHLTNVLLHSACSLLVCLLALGLGASRPVAWVTGLLFAVHPIHTESVAWIAGRTDVLCFLFAGASLGLFLARERSRSSGARRLCLTASLLCFALALLAKEMVAVVPLWIVAIAAWRSAGGRLRDRLTGGLRVALPWLAIVVGYALLRFLVLDVAPPDAPLEHSLARAVASAPSTVVRYLGWMAFPGELSAYVQNPYVTRLADPRLLGSLIALGLLAALVARLSRARAELGLLAAMLALSFAPILNFVRIAGPPDMGAPMAERFAYLPSFVFLLLLVTVGEMALARLRRPARRKALAAAGLLVVTPLYAWKTIERNRDWRDEVTFFERATAQTPGAPLLWTNLAQAEMRAGRPAEAERAIRQAERLTPEAPWVLAVRAQWLTFGGRFAEALPIQERVVRLERQGNALALNNLAFLLRSNGRTAEALAVVSELSERLPSYPDPWLNIAEIERVEGDREAAVAAYLRYLGLRPRDLRAVETLSGLYSGERRFDEAEALFTATLRGDALDARIWNHIATLRLARGDARGSLAAVEKSLEIDPLAARARFNRAKLLALAGRVSEGRAEFEALVREAPASDVGAAARRELAASTADAAAGENRRP